MPEGRSAKYMIVAASPRTSDNGKPHQNAANETSQPPIPSLMVAVTMIALTDSDITTSDETSGTK